MTKSDYWKKLAKESREIAKRMEAEGGLQSTVDYHAEQGKEFSRRARGATMNAKNI